MDIRSAAAASPPARSIIPITSVGEAPVPPESRHCSHWGSAAAAYLPKVADGSPPAMEGGRDPGAARDPRVARETISEGSGGRALPEEEGTTPPDHEPDR